MNHRDIAVLMEGIAPVLRGYVERAFEPIGVRLAAMEERFKGLPEHSGAPEVDQLMILRLVQEEVAKIPVPLDGRDADPALVADLVEKALAALPPAKDGEPGPAGDSVTVDQLGPLVAEEVAKAVAALPPARDGKDGRDGVGVAGAFIDRSGELTVTLSDGATKSLGMIVGVDGQPGKAGKDGEPGRDGIDGLGFEDMSIEHDGERGVVLRFERGEIKKEFSFSIPSVIDRGVWREGQYQKGDGATWAGSFFIAQRDTTDKPETSDAWRLSVKRGRDGKDGKPGERGPDGPQGKAGRDLTQIGADGAKW